MADPAVRSCEVLVIRRAESPRDSWSGQMALPGGSLDPADGGLLAAAIRETREETGLLLEADRGVLGRIATVRPLGVRLPVISVWPFVFHVPYEAVARVASPEVASVHWFPVAELVDAANHVSYPWKEAGLVRSFPCIQVKDRVIWGLTYRILTRFLELV